MDWNTHPGRLSSCNERLITFPLLSFPLSFLPPSLLPPFFPSFSFSFPSSFFILFLLFYFLLKELFLWSPTIQATVYAKQFDCYCLDLRQDSIDSVLGSEVACLCEWRWKGDTASRMYNELKVGFPGFRMTCFKSDSDKWTWCYYWRGKVCEIWFPVFPIICFHLILCKMKVVQIFLKKHLYDMYKRALWTIIFHGFPPFFPSLSPPSLLPSFFPSLLPF